MLPDRHIGADFTGVPDDSVSIKIPRTGNARPKTSQINADAGPN